MSEPNMVEIQSPEATIDAALDKFESGLSEPAATQPEETTSEPEVKEGETAPTETDEKPEDVTEGEDKQTVKDPVRERLARQRDAERTKRAEAEQKLQQYEKERNEWHSVMNRPEVIRARMKDEGYTPEAINARLKSMGYEVPDSRPDIFGLLQSKLGINPETLDENARYTLTDIGKIFDVMLEDRFSRVLPGQIAPLEKQLTEMSRKESAKEMVATMRDTVKDEGILDFAKDIEPELAKFVQENPQAKQEDLLAHFEKLNHTLALERLRTKDKKTENDKKKEVLKDKTAEGGVARPGTWQAKHDWKSKGASNVDDLLDKFGVGY